MKAIIEQPHAHSPQQIEQALRTDPLKGLDSEEADKRFQQYGPNELEAEKTKSPLLIFLQQFLNPIVYVLAVATVLAFVFEEWIEGIAVLIVIFLNSIIGFIMEWQAVRSMKALQEMAQTIAHVFRDQQLKDIPSRALVPGDVIHLAMGDVVPADARLIREKNLAVKEAALTGESVQVEKDINAINHDTALAERVNMLYKGTLVTRGMGRAIVTATGTQTELGRISKLTKQAKKEITPLEKRLNDLSKRLIWLTLVVAVIIAVMGIIEGKELVLMIETAIALAVAAIPEGLPIVATIALARGMLRLGRRSVIVKKLEAVQTLGEASVICTDKTGTLTENRMMAQVMLLSEEQIELDHTFKANGLKSAKIQDMAAFELLIRVGILCNEAVLQPKNGTEPKGDPIEIALLELAEATGHDTAKIRNEYPQLVEFPFDTDMKMMGTINAQQEGQNLICVKGALEAVLDRCDAVFINGEKRPLGHTSDWEARVEALAQDGLRMLSFAFAETTTLPEAEEDFMDHLTFLGVVAFLDPPRAEVRQAIETCQKAGIRVVMVTGDHPGTARTIAEEVGLLPVDASDEKVMHGREVKQGGALTPELEKRLLETTVFARVTPEQKLDLVHLYQKHKQIVGMTGDGVNDAPALKKADIGIAMGIRGTEAAKEVADVILKDDAFSSIELAIEQGRVIFENIRKFVVYLLSCNLAEILVVATASISGLPLPLLPLQILYINLITDVFPALALGMRSSQEGIMDLPPRRQDEPIISRQHWMSTIAYGFSVTVSVMGITLYSHFATTASEAQVNNLGFYTLVLSQLLNVFNLPHRNTSFIRNEVTSNRWVWGAIVLCIGLTGFGFLIPGLRDVLSLVPLSWNQVGLVGLFSLSTLVVAQLIKRLGGTV